MPAAAVIPAPEAYIKVAAVKKLVVVFLALVRRVRRRKAHEYVAVARHHVGVERVYSLGAHTFTLKKLECLKQAFQPLHILAWNNKIGLGFYFVGF